MKAQNRTIEEIMNILENYSRNNSNGTQLFLDSQDFREVAEGIFILYFNLKEKEKRWEAACRAMQGIINNEKFLTDLNDACDDEWVRLKEAISVNAFEIADEMIKQEKKEQK